MFRHRQQLRRWAARALLLWLFGFGAGIANACLASGQAAPLAAAATHLVAAAQALDDLASRDASQADHGILPSHRGDAQAHQGSVAEADCPDFCAKAAVSIPLLKSTLEEVQFHAVIATAAVTVLPLPALAPVQSWESRLDGAVRTTAIAIAFLRLTL